MGTKSDPVSKPGTTNVPGGSRARPEADHAPGTSRGGNSHWASRRLGFSAAETADILDTTPASVDSALRRARTTLDDRLPGGGAALALPADLVARYVRAWHAQVVPSLVAVLQEDAYTAMRPTRLGTRAAITSAPTCGSCSPTRGVATSAHRPEPPAGIGGLRPSRGRQQLSAVCHQGADRPRRTYRCNHRIHPSGPIRQIRSTAPPARCCRQMTGDCPSRECGSTGCRGAPGPRSRARVVDQDVNAIGSGKAGAREPSGSDAERDYPRPTAGVW